MWAAIRHTEATDRFGQEALARLAEQMFPDTLSISGKLFCKRAFATRPTARPAGARRPHGIHKPDQATSPNCRALDQRDWLTDGSSASPMAVLETAMRPAIPSPTTNTHGSDYPAKHIGWRSG